MWIADRRQGFGTMTWFDNENSYVGQWHNHHRHGKGVLTRPNIDTYEGMWVANMKEGFGKLTWLDGDTYEGYFHKDLRLGEGKYISPSKFTYPAPRPRADARSVFYVPNVTPELTPTERCLAYLQAFRYRMLDSLKQADTSLTAYTDAELSAHPSFPSHFSSKTFKNYLQEQQFLPNTPADNATLDSLIAAQVALCTLDEAA